jgi:hypothetical protein
MRRSVNPREVLRLRCPPAKSAGKAKVRNSAQDDEGRVGVVRGYEENLYTGGWISTVRVGSGVVSSDRGGVPERNTLGGLEHLSVEPVLTLARLGFGGL